MSISETITESRSFTVTHAIHMAAKVAADLKRIQRLYDNGPSDQSIADYEKEVVIFLKAGYLGTVTYGFWRNGAWIEPTLRYTAADLAGAAANDDDPGRVRPGASTVGATFYSYLTYSAAWYRLTASDQEAFKKTLPFPRGGAPEPTVSGALVSDRTYSAGGWALNRASVRSS